tara:strand:- start:901 stop:1386 length:486 start_codon:yes stop_codon:yes gene_type:complete
MIRTGIGYDVHQLAKDRKLIIAGVEIPSPIGSIGHSDGDALIHAIVDALLGAAALGDIGQFFPSNDNALSGKPSRVFLDDAVLRIKAANFKINNVDATIIIQEPKLSSYIAQIKCNLADNMHINEGQVSIKATTTDNLGFIGNQSGWAVQAIATISQTRNE